MSEIERAVMLAGIVLADAAIALNLATIAEREAESDRLHNAVLYLEAVAKARECQAVFLRAEAELLHAVAEWRAWSGDRGEVPSEVP